MMATLHTRDSHGLAAEILDRQHIRCREQLEAADVSSGKDQDRVSGIDSNDELSGEADVDVGPALRQRAIGAAFGTDILHVGKAFAAKKLLRHELRGKADRRAQGEPESFCLGRRLRSSVLWPEQKTCPCQGQTTHESASTPAYTSVTHE